MTINDSVRNQLQSALQVRTSGEAARWLLDARKEAETGSRERLLAIYTEASMRLGRLPLAAPLGESSTAAPEGLALDRWTLEDAARAVFLLARVDHATFEGFEADARACYEMGDAREQQVGCGRCPAAGPRPVPRLVIDACRTNILPVFEAVA
jgi:hypothetical protein